jgi:hypothetical protein
MSMPSSAEPESIANEACAGPAWLHPLLLAVALLVMGFLFAMVEIQIEGAAGWAANLPTWRIERHPLLDLFWGGKPMTGYHVWVFSFMAAMFHMPLALLRTFSIRLEARIVGCIMTFWIIEDFLWFVMNPAFGLGRFGPGTVPWHKAWLLGVPVDYWVFMTIGCCLLAWSFRRSGGVPGRRAARG